MDRFAATGDRRDDLACAALLCAVWAIVIVAVGLGGDYPLNDDWAYAWSARHLLSTGRMRILEWAAPSLVAHVAWGAALIRLFGDSYVVLRAGTLALGLLGILAVYALARRTGLAPRRAILPALAVALSPWFVNLSFTFMSDVPWLTVTVAALCACACAFQGDAPPTAGFLLLAGALTGLGALIRQFSVITVPAFLVAILVDGRNRRAPGWRVQSLISALWFAVPVLACFAPFQWWYTHVHGPTLANRETWTRMRAVTWEPFVHAIVVLHYAGLWLAPLTLPILAKKRWREGVEGLLGRRAALLAGATLGIHAIVVAIVEHFESISDHHPAMRHYTMPYLGNILYQTGLGPPTIYDVYSGIAPPPHRSLGFGIALTLISVASGVLAAGLLARSASRAFATVRRPPEGSEAGDARRASIRLLLVGFSTVYLLWQLCTSTFVFDRYLMPLIPCVWILALPLVDELPVAGPGGRPTLGLIALGGLLSIVGTREYLGWNGARDRAVRALEASGVRGDDIDGGFEVNGPRLFPAWFERTHQLFLPDGGWWSVGAHYRIAMSSPGPGCAEIARDPYWTLPGTGEHAIYTLRCAPSGSSSGRVGAEAAAASSSTPAK